MGCAVGKLSIDLLGPFRVRRSSGEDCTPTARKACAILAMLALTPDARRSRVWIQDKLWGSRGKEQGAASLRQCLVEIRKVLGSDRDILRTETFIVSLDPARFCLDFDANGSGNDIGSGEFLEGLDIGEEGFEEWLRAQRQKIRGVSSHSSARVEPAHLGFSEASDGKVERQHKLILERGRGLQNNVISVSVDGILDTIAQTVSELGAALVIDRRGALQAEVISEISQTQHALALHSDIAGTEENRTCRIVLSNRQSNELVWSSLLQGENLADTNNATLDFLRCVNQTASIAISSFIQSRQQEATDANEPSALCQLGIASLFKLGKANFDRADIYFERAYALEPRGTYLAWRAFLRTFLIAERQYSCRKTVSEEAIGLLRRALELEPHNSYVAALGAHVHTIIRRSYVAAYELAERSIQLNQANPIGWACLGMAKCYLGKAEEGFRHTLFARSISGSAPYRFHLDALSCIAGSTAGKLNEAIHLGEASHALAPGFAAPLRYLSALYLHSGEHELSHEIVQKLQAIEPDFCYQKLLEKDYPAAGLRSTGILDHLPVRQF